MNERYFSINNLQDGFIKLDARLGISLQVTPEELEILKGDPKKAQDLLMDLLRPDRCAVGGDTYFPQSWNEEYLDDELNFDAPIRPLQTLPAVERTPEMIKIKTIESERCELAEDGMHVKHVGMITYEEAFNQLKAHLEKTGLIPDEYFSLAPLVEANRELPPFRQAFCHTNWGVSEGVYIDIILQHVENRQVKYSPFITAKTLGDNGEAFLKMSRIAAECSMMLNGCGSIVHVPENSYNNLQREEPAKTSLDSRIKAAEAFRENTNNDIEAKNQDRGPTR